MITPAQKIRLLVEQARWFERMGNKPAHAATLEAIERQIALTDRVQSSYEAWRADHPVGAG